jgi:hypothetical protein
METIWDHHPTDDELKRLAVYNVEYYHTMASQDSHLKKIIGLIGLRGGSVAEQMVYVNRIHDPLEKLDWTLLLNEVGD